MVAILLGTGFEESEALVPADLLRRAGIEVRLVGVDGPAVTSAHGVTVTADLTLAELDREAVDMLVLPGGLGGVEVLQGDRHVQALIQHCYDEGRWLGAWPPSAPPPPFWPTWAFWTGAGRCATPAWRS